MIRLLVVSFVWAFSFPLIKGRLTGIDPDLVAFLRLSLSLAVFLPFFRRNHLTLRTASRLVVIGAVQFGLMYVLYIRAYQYLPAHMIVLLTVTTPLFVILFNDLPAGRLNVRHAIAALLAVGGSTVIQYPDQPFSLNMAGVLLVQGSNIAFAAGQTVYRSMTRTANETSLSGHFALLYLGGTACTLLFLSTDALPDIAAVSSFQWGVLFYLGVIASGFCFFLWNGGARKVNAGTLAVMNNVKIPLGIGASLLLLGEETDLLRLVLGSLFLGAALWIVYRRSPVNS